MNDTRPGGDTNRYEIRVGGRLDARWSAWFEGHRLTAEPDGTTVIEVASLDQAALHGLLRQVRDAGLSLISVTLVEPPATTTDGSER